MTNLDGDNAFRAETLEESVKLLQEEVDANARVGVKTLAYSIGSGSEVLLYPTKVANTWGWQDSPESREARWASRIARNKRNQDAGGDGPGTAGRQAKKNGMYFFPSQRMNDAHYCFSKDPAGYPLTGKFWIDNQDLAIKDSPIKAKSEYGHLLDFTHEKVRNYRLAIAFEAIDRYADIMDGYELDFTRFQIFFPAGKAWERRELLTDLVRKVRAKLDEVGKARGKSYVLIARTPPAPHNCKWSGIDVETWAKEGLVDVIAPSQMMTMGFEQPIDQFKKMVAGTGVKVYAGMLPRIGWSFEFKPNPEAGKLGKLDRALSVPQLRGAALNMMHLGADGLSLFNFTHYVRWGTPKTAGADGGNLDALRHPGADDRGPSRPGAIDLTDIDSLRRSDQVYSISKAYWMDHEDGYEYSKQVPAELGGGKKQSFQLLVGADLTDAKTRQAVKHAALRLGLRQATPEAVVRVSLNGRKLFDGPLASKALPTVAPSDAKTAAAVKARPDAAQQVLQLPVEDLSAIRQGQNEVTVEVQSSGGAEPLSLTDIDLGIFFTPVRAN